MRRDRATDLLEDLLEQAVAGRPWPLDVVEGVLVFGSYARGALEPGDLDVAVDLNRENARFRKHFIDSISSGRDPYAVVRRALRGRKRGASILFERNSGHDDVPMTPIWTRDEPLEVALERVHAIPVDAAAGRALRHAMLPCFEEIDEWVPRFVREELISLISSEIVTVDQIELADATVNDPWIADTINRRWRERSPLRRAAHAAVAHLESQGIDIYAVHLHGKDIAEEVTPYYAGFSLRYMKNALYCFRDHTGVEWIDVVHPTRRGPLRALRLRPGVSFNADTKYWRAGGFFA